MPLPGSEPAPETQVLVGMRSLATRLAALIPVSAVERWRSTTGIPIPQWALQRCCSIPPASRNTAVGTDALVNNTVDNNTAIGVFCTLR